MLNATLPGLQRWRVLADFANQDHEPPMVRASFLSHLFSVSLPFTGLEPKENDPNESDIKNVTISLGDSLWHSYCYR